MLLEWLPGGAVARCRGRENPTRGHSCYSGAVLGLAQRVIGTIAAACFAVVPLSARAADLEPPTIFHEEVQSARLGEPLVVRAHIVDDSGVFDPAVLYRVGGRGAFLRLTLVPVASAADLFEVSVPGELVGDDVEYFIEAFDAEGNGPARYGDEQLPVRVRVLKTAEPREPGAPAGGTGEETEGAGAGLWIGLGGGTLAVLLVGAAAAGVAAVLFLQAPKSPSQVNVIISAPSPAQAGVSP
jgi:hypothetical protein